MSDIRYVATVIVYEDGHRDVIWDSSVSMEDCYVQLKQVTQDLENALDKTPPPTPSKKSSPIIRLK